MTLQKWKMLLVIIAVVVSLAYVYLSVITEFKLVRNVGPSMFLLPVTRLIEVRETDLEKADNQSGFMILDHNTSIFKELDDTTILNSSTAKQLRFAVKSHNLTLIVNTSLTNTSAAGKLPEQPMVITTPTPDETFIPNIGECHGCLAGKRLITVQKGWICGAPRLGNKMFMIAPAIVYSFHYNATLVLLKGDNDQCQWPGMLRDLFLIFNQTTPIIPYSMTKKWDNVGESGFTAFEPLKSTTKNLTMTGYRQSWKFFGSKAEEKAVREAFTYTQHYDIGAKKTIELVKSRFRNITTNPILVGVHMRIGDLLQSDRLEYGYQMANFSFYDKAMTFAIQLTSNSISSTPTNKLPSSQTNQLTKPSNDSSRSPVIFLVASDSHNEAKQVLKGLQTKYNIYWLTGSAFEDFAVLSKCDHSIMSGGTFGFWAAWLAGGKTFYFGNFARPNSSFSKGFKSENFYLPSWTPVYV